MLNSKFTVSPGLKVLWMLLLPMLSATAFAASWEQSSQREIEALRKGDVAAVKRYFGADNKPGLDDYNIVQEALPAALESGSVELIKFLKYKGWLDVCRKDKECLPIHIAAGRSGSVPLIRYLMAEGFDGRTKNEFGATALHAAAEGGHLAAVKFLCENHFDATQRKRSNETVLDVAVSGLSTGAGVLSKDVLAQHEEVIEYLKGRTCKVGTDTSGPTYAPLPLSRSVSLNPNMRVNQLFVGSAYGARLCARFQDSTHRCWSNEDFPDSIQNVRPVVDPIGKLKTVQIALGSTHVCVLLNTGQVKCWGSNEDGQLGLGDTRRREGRTPDQIAQLLFVDLGPNINVREIVAGRGYTCVLLEGGSVKCWGRASWRFGDTHNRGSKPGEMGANLPSIDLGSGVKAVHIAGGDGHVCALLGNGTAKCWGDNRFGQLGLGDIRSRPSLKGDMGDNLPIVDLDPRVKATQITAGARHSCALLDTGKVKCWGANYYGQLGVGDARSRGDSPNEMGDKLSFVDLGTNVKVVQIMADRDGTCALLDNGGVKCWGYNGRGYFPAEMGDNLPYVKFQ